jgi:2-octaprenyl-6-methoxyphenol hydroxylase
MHDLAIIGAGPVGATFALALANGDRDVVVLDARKRGATLREDRSLALSHGSQLILERLGVWRELATTEGAVTPIAEIDVSQAGGFGVTRLTATEQGVPALGYVVSYIALQRALDAALEAAGVDVRFGARVVGVRGLPASARVDLDGIEESALEARLVAVADGAGTPVEGIGRERHDYGQNALVASVWRDVPHRGIAYERFTPTGPIALLPERDHYGLVWTLAPERTAPMLAVDDHAFLAHLAHAIGARVGGFNGVAARRAFPLSLERARAITGSRVAMIGNAAQQLHPVAGQGFNLGLRDAWQLGEVVLDASRDELGSAPMLARYAARRRLDRGAGIAFTHGLVGVFGAAMPLIRMARGAGLALLDMTPPAKRALTRAMLFGLR